MENKFQKITSRQNNIIRLFRSLIREKKARNEENSFVVEGAKLCYEAIRSGCAAEQAIVTEAALEKYKDITDIIAEKCEIFVINGEMAEYISDTKAPQGIFLKLKLLDKRLNSDTIKNSSRFLLLDRLQDNGNIGTIIRMAEGLGADGVILSEDSGDVYSPKTVRAAMGSLFRLPFAVMPLSEAIGMMKKSGYKIYGAMLDESAVKLKDVTFAAKSAMVIGNEGNGISDETAELLDTRVYIPMRTAESLNAAIAASILTWEMCKK